MTEGTVVVRKDATLPVHSQTKICNLHVMLMLRTMTTKEYVTEKYVWGYYYYVLTAEGIEFLREQLNLPPTVLPSTYVGSQRSNDREGNRDSQRTGTRDTQREPIVV